MDTLWQVSSNLQKVQWRGKPVREICSRILNFICSENYQRVWWISEEGEHYLRSLIEANEYVAYRWAVTSPNVDLVATHLVVDAEGLKRFLQTESGFNIETTYKPNRVRRMGWLNTIRLPEQ